jgi:hypothetical protein
MVVIPSTLSDHPSLVGIVRFPSCSYTTQEVPVPLVIKDENNNFMSMRQLVDMATTIDGSEKTSNAISIPKGTITDFYPYTFYVLTDGEGEPVIMQPQYMPSSLVIKGKFALSHQPVERYYPVGYRGDNDGTVYNITNLNQMMLPTATNEGLSYMNANANTIMQNRKSQITGNVLNGINTVASAIATGGMSLIGGGVSGVINGIMEIKNTDARNKDSFLTPSTISSFGTPSTRQAFGTDNVRLLRYTVKDNIKQKINNFVNRYGNKYNNYATIDLKTYKGYVKYISPDIDSTIDNVYISKIKEILERGVYIE